MSRGARKTREEISRIEGEGVKCLFFNGGIALTAAWQRRPRQCLLGF